MAAARAAEAERRGRRDARRRAVTSRLPRRPSRPSGILAERRRRQLTTTVALVLALNVLVWVLLDDWSVRAMVLAVSLLALPVLHTVLFRR